MNDAMFVYIHVCVVCMWVRLQMLNMFLSWLRLRHDDRKPTLGLGPLRCVDTVFVRPQIACQTLENPKISFSLLGVTRTYIMAWHNPFGHWSAQSTILSQNDQNALGQPWVDQRSNKVKIPQNNIFHGFISNLSSSEIFSNFDQVWLGVNLGWVQKH